jgi:uncharacterized protein YjiS (DUF1127 family)
MRYSATAGSAGEFGAPREGEALSALRAVFAPLWARVQSAALRRRRAGELIGLDERQLRDIGIAEEEIPGLLAAKRLLPVGWPD